MSSTTLDLTGFHKQMKDLIGVAIDLGWVARQEGSPSHGKGTVVLHAYDNSQSIRATPVRQINEAKLRTMRAKVVRYAEPLRRAEMVAKIEWAEMRAHGPTADDAFNLSPTSTQIQLAGAAVEVGVSDSETVQVPGPEIVSERPWLARRVATKSGGLGYESQAVIERTWSDGAVEYVCAFIDCGYTHHRARSVANHYGAAHTSKGLAEPTNIGKGRKSTPLVDHFEPTFHKEYKPTDRLIQALSDFLANEMLDGADLTNIAEAALRWAHERPDLPDLEHHVPAALDPEDILERIRLLVGAPLAARVAEAEAQIVHLVGDLEDANEARRRAEDRWSALKSIVDQEDEQS